MQEAELKLRDEALTQAKATAAAAEAARAAAERDAAALMPLNCTVSDLRQRLHTAARQLTVEQVCQHTLHSLDDLVFLVMSVERNHRIACAAAAVLCTASYTEPHFAANLALCVQGEHATTQQALDAARAELVDTRRKHNALSASHARCHTAIEDAERLAAVAERRAAAADKAAAGERAAASQLRMEAAKQAGALTAEQDAVVDLTRKLQVQLFRACMHVSAKSMRIRAAVLHVLSPPMSKCKRWFLQWFRANMVTSCHRRCKCVCESVRATVSLCGVQELERTHESTASELRASRLAEAASAARAADLDGECQRLHRDLDESRALHAAAVKVVQQYEGGVAQR